MGGRGGKGRGRVGGTKPGGVSSSRGKGRKAKARGVPAATAAPSLVSDNGGRTVFLRCGNYTTLRVLNVPGGTQIGALQQGPVGGAPYVQLGSVGQEVSYPGGGVIGNGQVMAQQLQPCSGNSKIMLHHRLSAHPGANAVGGLVPFPIQGQQMPNIHSMTSNIATPMFGTPLSSSQNPEDQQCVSKLNRLRQHVGYLLGMMTNAEHKDMGRIDRLSTLLKFLSTPNQQVPKEHLRMCESALKTIEKHYVADLRQLEPAPLPTFVPAPQQPDEVTIIPDQSQLREETDVPTAPPPTPKPTEPPLPCPFQQLQDAVLSTLKMGPSSQSFLKKFTESVEMLNGAPFP